MLKYVIMVLLFPIYVMAGTCMELFEGFKSALDPQLTVFCKTEIPDAYGYKFYLRDEDNGYINAMLVFNDYDFHLFFEGFDINPYKCTDEAVYKTETPNDILKLLFAPRIKDCEESFMEMYSRL